MADKLALTVVTPAREVITVEADEITAPGWEGEFGVLPGHAPFLALIRSGELMYRIGEERNYVAVGFGFVEVLPEKVTVLIETAERLEEIDFERAMQARDRAMEVLSGKQVDVDFEAARAALMRALSRLKVAEKIRGIPQRKTKI